MDKNYYNQLAELAINDDTAFIELYEKFFPLVYGMIFARIKDISAADDFQKLSNGTINFDIVEPAVANTFLSNCWRYDKNTSPNGCRREICSSEDTRLIFMEKIKNPVLIIEGSRDLYINRASLSKVVKNLQSDCEFIEIEGGSHVVMIEKPYYKKFRNAVLRFLAD